jgi:CheY-like chemotaxis protein/anti-sigma regulatory factor (Ser/Thr protein kinase)
MNAEKNDTKLLQERLEQAAIITGRLAHDFGNFLTGILGFTELSLSQAPADSTQRRFLQEVLQSAQNGATWIHRLQLFCRRSAGPCWPTHLAGVLAQEEARVAATPGSNLRWRADVPRDLPLLAMEASALQLAVQEIVNNAREATANQGTITLTARKIDLTAAECQDIVGAVAPGTYVELAIADDGPGIPAAERAKMFREIFYSTKPRQRGVGLLVVYGILQRFHGGLRLDMQGPGLGVRLYLPAAAIAGPALTSAAKPPQLLLAHANPQVFDSVRVILEAHGCLVTEVASPHAAVAACATPRAAVTLTLVDLTVSPMAGLDLARRILDQDAKMKFIFLHTQTSFHGLAEEELLRRFPLLRWPLQPAVLLNAVQTALARSSTEKV